LQRVGDRKWLAHTANGTTWPSKSPVENRKTGNQT
jgi:hypothetical protein